jgi:hypothetical protein
MASDGPSAALVGDVAIYINKQDRSLSGCLPY